MEIPEVEKFIIVESGSAFDAASDEEKITFIVQPWGVEWCYNTPVSPGEKYKIGWADILLAEYFLKTKQRESWTSKYGRHHINYDPDHGEVWFGETFLFASELEQLAAQARKYLTPHFIRHGTS